ncbi:hypothetical protein [Shewanella glacialimarina]|jgi:hypothetical protein|uniref:hypothetical protein n=1 Tax=Shewanella glacialimarina TaxID=2590884 RepID=UPI001CF85ADD|nr:hypothetical protein [Shewanella glacialimarina]UCX06459.1 hypothetical protein FJ709_19305 [Shewanella glacialimarina]
MRGWIGLAIIGGIIYYFATETDKLDEPIEYVQTMFDTADKKVSSMTGTKIQRVDHKLPILKEKIYERLSTIEIRELDGVFTDSDSIAEFKETYCSSSKGSHPVFSRDNLQFICDQI